VKPFIAELKINYRVVAGDDATSDKYGGVEDLPTTFLIDKQGKIAAIHIGLAGRKEFEDGVEELLRETPGAPVTSVGSPVPAAVVATKH
jgi:cytochrome c biogenesis protein CcmG/thiol:disulfide interchange protein DsbE